MKKHNVDSSAMQITEEDKKWGHSVVFNDSAMSFKNSLLSDPNNYKQYFPPEEKKLNEKIAVINFLNLKEQSKKLTVLDIGTGCGHFITLLNSLGHDCYGTETKDSIKILESLHSHYNLNVFELEIKKQTEFSLPTKYNLITSLRTVFDYDGPWSCSDWKFFKENLFEYLEPAGEIFIKTNIKSIPSQVHQLDSVFGKSLNGWNSLTFHIKKL